MLKEVVKFMRYDNLVAEDEDPIPEYFSDEDDDNDENIDNALGVIIFHAIQVPISKQSIKAHSSSTFPKLG